MSRYNGETSGNPLHFAIHFELRDRVRPHEGSVGGTEPGDKDCAHIFRGEFHNGNRKRLHTIRLLLALDTGVGKVQNGGKITQEERFWL